MSAKTFWCVLATLLFGFSLTTSATTENEQLINSYLKIYRASKSPKDLLSRLPRVDAHAYAVLSKALGSEFSSPLPRLDFDLNKSEIMVGKVHLRVVNLKEGSFLIEGRPYQYLGNEGFDHNLKRFLETLAKKPTQSARRWDWLLPEAWAEAHNFDLMPGVDPVEARDQLSTATGVLAASPWMSSLIYNSTNVVSSAAFGSNFFEHSAGGAIGRTGFYGALAPFVYYGSNFVTANAPGVPDCVDQAYALARIMNEGQINLKELKCNNWSAFVPLQVAFTAPGNDREFRFDIDWFTVGIRNRSLVQSIARVGPNTIYEFSRDDLVGVRLESPVVGPNDENSGRVETRILTSASTGPDLELFNQHKNAFERYRRVMREVARNNSCYRCQNEFARILVRRSGYQPYRVANPTGGTPPSGSTPPTTR